MAKNFWHFSFALFAVNTANAKANKFANKRQTKDNGRPSFACRYVYPSHSIYSGIVKLDC